MHWQMVFYRNRQFSRPCSDFHLVKSQEPKSQDFDWPNSQGYGLVFNYPKEMSSYHR